MQLMQEQMRQGRGGAQDDDSLAKAMQKQMQQLMESWAPRHAKFVTGTAPADKAEAQTAAQQEEQAAQARQTQTPPPKTLVAAGTVNYVQLLTEANSDVPGPILAQILSGPLSGGRAIGRFQVMGDYLVMTFNTVSLKGKDYPINAMALDPDTTLGGMATEVDHRYLSRVLLPAAGAFVSAFGKALAETDTETTVSDGTVVSEQAKKGTKEAIYSGIGEMGETVADFLRDEAKKTKTLVRVAVGTPMGLFFLNTVKEESRQ
jgi:intracellular multiplication protein IcmE